MNDGITIQKVGPFTVHLLPREVEIADGALMAGLSTVNRMRLHELKVPGRRLEFLRARWLVRTILGLASDPPHNPGGFLEWPPGVTGSLSHKNGWVACLLAGTNEWCSVGLDLEVVGPHFCSLQAKIVTEQEWRSLVQNGEALAAGKTLAAIFAFKEALFKCHFPLGRRMFYFHDAEINSIDLTQGTVAARVLESTSPLTLRGSGTRGNINFFTGNEVEWVLATAGIPRES